MREGITVGREEALEEYVDLLHVKYGKEKNFAYFLEDARIAYTYCKESDSVRFLPVTVFEEGKLIAHTALILDTRLTAGEAFFGFFEVPDDQAVFNLLWEELVRIAKSEGVRVLKGPISGSIWHQYRCVRTSDGSPSFSAEPVSELFYHDFLVSKKPSVTVGYLSAYRTRFDTVLRLLGAVSYGRLSAMGFTLREADTVSLDEMREVARISKEVFSSNWGYTELTESEFLALYSPSKMGAHLRSLYLLHKGEDLVGYLSTAQEDTDTIVCKTVCILPEFQGRGLGAALAYRVHEDARKSGVKKIIYALIREGNALKKFPKEDTVVFREYAAFEFSI